MKTTVKKLSLAVVAAFGIAASTHTLAASVGGVTWDPTIVNVDWTVEGTMVQDTVVNGVEGLSRMVSGFGRVTSINGDAGFCAACELTYTYTGYFENVAGQIGNPLFQNSVRLHGGTVQFWVDSTPDTSFVAGGVVANNPLSFGSNWAGAGTPAQILAQQTGAVLWLDLVAVDRFNDAETAINPGPDGVIDLLNPDAQNTTAIYDWTPGTVGVDGSGMVGHLDVVGGLADPWIVRDSYTLPGSGQLADLNFDFGITNQINKLFDRGTGTGSFFGKTRELPEPASLSLAGLALLGMGALRRRRENQK